MKAKGIRPPELATLIGCQPEGVYAWTSGTCAPSLPLIFEICDLFGISDVRDLFFKDLEV